MGRRRPSGGRARPAHAGRLHPQTAPRGTPGVPTETLSEQSAPDGNGLVPELLQRLHRYFGGEPVSFADVPLDEDWGTPFQAALAAALRSVPWGEIVSYGELSALAGRSARGAGSRHLLRREPLLALRALPPGRRRWAGSAGTVSSASSTSAVSSPSRAMGLSDDLRSELAAIAPKRGCCRHAEISALFHSAGTIHLRGRGEVALHLDLASSGVARRAFSLLRELGIHSEIRTYPRRAFDRATRYQLHVTGDEARSARSSRRASSTPGTRRWSGPRSASSVAPAAAGHICAGRCSAAARSRGRGRRIWSSGRPRSRGPSSCAPSLRRATSTVSVLDRGRHAAAYAKGFDAIEAVLGAAGAGDTVLAFEERSVVAAARGEANRLANADHANLVRTSRAAQEQLEAVRALQAAGALERLPDRLYEVARLRLRHPTLPLRELAAKCDPPTHESLSPPAGVQEAREPRVSNL